MYQVKCQAWTDDDTYRFRCDTCGQEWHTGSRQAQTSARNHVAKTGHTVYGEAAKGFCYSPKE